MCWIIDKKMNFPGITGEVTINIHRGGTYNLWWNEGTTVFSGYINPDGVLEKSWEGELDSPSQEIFTQDYPRLM